MRTSMRVRYYALEAPRGRFRWPEEPSDWTFRRLLQDPRIREGWVSFDAVVFDPTCGRKGSVWCGLNVLDPLRYGILYRFDLAEERFFPADLNGAIEPFDVKVHKGMSVWGGKLVFGTASFMGPPDQAEAPGGKIIVYDTARDRVQVCAVPVGPASGFPLGGQYVQSVLHDPDRDVVYGCTYRWRFSFFSING